MSTADRPPGRGRDIGIGLISVGWMGRLHSKAYRLVNYHYPELGLAPRLIVAADVVAERARVAVAELGYAASTADWMDVLRHPEVEAVSITAPNYLHQEMGTAAARHGKHFWIEKPVGRGLDETRAIERAAVEADVRTAVGFNYRHAPAVQHARALIQSGQIGRVTHVRGVFLNDYAAEPQGALSWRFQRALAGSGALGDLLSHMVDLLQYIVAPVTEVSALTATMVTERPAMPMGTGTHFAVIEGGDLKPVENEDYVGALLRFAGGAVGMCEASRVTVGRRCQLAFDIYGTDGAVTWDFERMGELQVCLGRSGPNSGFTRVLAAPGQGDYAAFQPGPAIAMSYDDLKIIEAAQFLRSIATGQQLAPSVTDARAMAEVLAAMEQAASSGRWTRVERAG